jgi:hypothetical protein
MVLKPLHRMRRRFDFLLAHGMKHARFDPYWRIHFPDNMSDSVGISGQLETTPGTWRRQMQQENTVLA